MKKTYQKPNLYAETFELCEHIADCTVLQSVTTATYRTRESCSYSDANISLFNPDVNGCVNDYKENMFDDFDDFLASLEVDRGGCYNAFSDGNFFAS